MNLPASSASRWRIGRKEAAPTSPTAHRLAWFADRAGQDGEALRQFIVGYPERHERPNHVLVLPGRQKHKALFQSIFCHACRALFIGSAVLGALYQPQGGHRPRPRTSPTNGSNGSFSCISHIASITRSPITLGITGALTGPLVALQVFSLGRTKPLEAPVTGLPWSRLAAYLSNPATCCVAHHASWGAQRPFSPVLTHKDSSGCIWVCGNNPSRHLSE